MVNVSDPLIPRFVLPDLLPVLLAVFMIPFGNPENTLSDDQINFNIWPLLCAEYINNFIIS